ncbi:LysR family transcriptional regulator [Shimia biformata]|uniref:LysR family transcriptional regulator n=1 Tax=Shimia biformata TaxID=1294299 RepID=UPI001EF2E643|nr:LysR family transcriptional regulator [Shimia biformata]
MKTALHLLRGGTLAAAAQSLGVNYTTVARRIARLEQAVGETLFERLADGYQPTEAARLVGEYVARMEDAQLSLDRRLKGRDQRLSGSLVITAPQLLIVTHLAEVIEAFCAAHPEVDLQVRATNDLLDLNRREADLAIRISETPGDALMGVRLTEQASASFANADWAERIRTRPADRIDWAVYTGLGAVPKASLKAYPNAAVKVQFDDMVALVGAAQRGLGVVRMPMFLGRATPGLVQVPVLEPQPYPSIWVVGHKDVWPSAKVTAFRNILVPFFRGRRAEFVA